MKIHQDTPQSPQDTDRWSCDYYGEEYSWIDDHPSKLKDFERSDIEKPMPMQSLLSKQTRSQRAPPFTCSASQGRRTSLHGKTISARISRSETRYRKLQAKTYNFLERPKTWHSCIYHGLVFASVLGSLIVSVLNTIEDLYKPAGRVLLYMELALLFWFFTEYCVRLWSAGCRSRYQTWRGRIQFARRPFCIVDIVIIIASVVVLAADSDRNVFAATALRGLRFFQILRMIRMDRRGGSFKLLASVVWAHRQELFTTMYIGFLCLIFMSFLIYLVEKKDNEKIRSYADALWWGVVTLCTVGYGDTVPRTWMGKLIAAFCSLAGVSFFALPAGILGSGFALKVQQHQRQKHLIRRRVPAATLIQSLWRCYAADPNSSSTATWKIHMRPVRKAIGISTSASIIERGGFSRFSRFSTLKRRPEKMIAITPPGILGSGDLIETRRGISIGHFEYSPLELKRASIENANNEESYLLSSPNTTGKVDVPSIHTRNNSCDNVKGSEKIEPLTEQDEFADDNTTVAGTLLSKHSSLRARRPPQCKMMANSPSDSSELLEAGIGFDRSPSIRIRELNESDKVMIRVIRKVKFFVARRKFREALRPYDVKDVIEQYSAGHLDMLTRVKILQARLDQILGRPGGKSEEVYDSRQSLASRIVKMEHKIESIELKIDRLVSMYKSDRATLKSQTELLRNANTNKTLLQSTANVVQKGNYDCTKPLYNASTSNPLLHSVPFIGEIQDKTTTQMNKFRVQADLKTPFEGGRISKNLAETKITENLWEDPEDTANQLSHKLKLVQSDDNRGIMDGVNNEQTKQMDTKDSPQPECFEHQTISLANLTANLNDHSPVSRLTSSFPTSINENYNEHFGSSKCINRSTNPIGRSVCFTSDFDDR